MITVLPVYPCIAWGLLKVVDLPLLPGSMINVINLFSKALPAL